MTDNTKFGPGDYVVYTHEDYRGVTGRVIKKYTPTACEEQTMIETSDGSRFHAPRRDFLKIG